MPVMFQHQHARIAMVFVVSLTLLTAGCRSTRNGLSGLPGMSWLAAEEVPNWGSDLEEPGLPPPSREATPQVTTNTNTSQESYPDTGYPSPYDDTDVSSAGTGKSAPTGYFNDSNSIKVSDGVDEATVGNTQQGFYGDEYGDGQDVADTGTSPSNDYDSYADTYTDQDYSSDTSDADPQFEQLGDSRQGQAEVDPYESDAHGDLSMPEQSNGMRDGYDKISQGVREGADAIADGAERMGDRVQDFAREQGDNIRSTVRDGYDRLNNLPLNNLHDQPVDDQPPVDGDGSQMTGPDSYADDAYSDYPTEATADSYDDYPQENYDDYPQDYQTNDPGASSSDQGPGASLNPPPGSNGYDRTNDVGEPGTPGRSVQPWRPGSTGTFRSSGIDSSHRSSYQDMNAVAPASYPGQTATSLQEQSTNDFPEHGWQSNSEGKPAQRLSPTHR